MAHVPSHPLPALYDRWLSELLTDPIPEETRSTCDDCAMCPKPGEVHAYPFDPEVKCCAYQPVLPNFLVGAILDDEGEDGAFGRQVLRQRLAQGIAATPLGVEPPAAYQVLHRHTVNTQGRSRTLRCPFHDGGRCGIHAHRNHLCATWFCRPVRGYVGRRFWDAVEGLLRAVERSLSRWCALELGVDPEVVAESLPKDPRLQPVDRIDAAAVDGRVDPAAQAARWGQWAGQEEAFYRTCAEKVAALGWEEVRRIGGSEVLAWERLLTGREEGMQRPSAPGTLRVGSYQTLAVGAEAVAVTGYSPLDPITLPRLLLDVLPYFDGRPNADAFQAIEDERGIRLDDALIRQLLDFGILVETR